MLRNVSNLHIISTFIFITATKVPFLGKGFRLTRLYHDVVKVKSNCNHNSNDNVIAIWTNSESMFEQQIADNSTAG